MHKLLGGVLAIVGGIQAGLAFVWQTLQPAACPIFNIGCPSQANFPQFSFVMGIIIFIVGVVVIGVGGSFEHKHGVAGRR